MTCLFTHLYDQVEENTSSSMHTLMELDGIKSQMQQTADALQVGSFVGRQLYWRDASLNTLDYCSAEMHLSMHKTVVLQ